MSLFKETVIDCPSCGRSLSFETVHSLNADRRPDLRAAMLDSRFQRTSCPHCGAGFRLDCDFTVLDVKRGQWVVAAPVAAIADWEAYEASARSMFARAYGDEAPPTHASSARSCKPRIVSAGRPCARSSWSASSASTTSRSRR